MQTKTILITGASSGIGLACAEILAQQGHQLILVAHHESSLIKVRNSLCEKYKQAKIFIFPSDLSLSKERQKLALALKVSFKKIDILLNNAGAVFSSFSITEEGIERSIALNHLGYFHLTLLLLDILKMGNQPQVLNVCSEAHFDGVIDFDSITEKPKINLQQYFKDWIKAKPALKILYLTMGFYLMQSYAQSKLANVLFTLYAAEKFKPLGIRMNCIHPGFVKSDITKTKFVRFYSRWFWKFAMGAKGISANNSAQIVVSFLLNTDKNFNSKYIQDGRITNPSELAQDKLLQEKLWNSSLLICKMNSAYL